MLFKFLFYHFGLLLLTRIIQNRRAADLQLRANVSCLETDVYWGVSAGRWGMGVGEGEKKRNDS